MLMMCRSFARSSQERLLCSARKRISGLVSRTSSQLDSDASCGSEVADACVVDKDFDRSEIPLGFSDEGFDVEGAPNVGTLARRAAPEPLESDHGAILDKREIASCKMLNLAPGSAGFERRPHSPGVPGNRGPRLRWS